MTLVMSDEFPEEAIKLVHGRPTLARPPFGKYAHAWCEVGELVVDRANGRNNTMPKAMYYERGSIDPAECFYYTYSEAREKLDEYKHWGPWEGPHGSPPFDDWGDDEEDEDDD